MTTSQQLQVAAIKNGTVIDHIAAGNALKIIRLLNLAKDNAMVTVGLNLPSKQMKCKDLIKVENRILSAEEANRVALFAPIASINLIENYAITKKFTVSMPSVIQGIVKCLGPKCITNNEPMETRFQVTVSQEKVMLRCEYCDKLFSRDEITDYKV